jgi:hypothetical protein
MKETREKLSPKYYHTARYTATIRNTKYIYKPSSLQRLIRPLKSMPI